jgi:hypothetical protein
VRGIVDRLLGEQLMDGGWNCEAENGSTRSSFNTTICVLEALLEHERSAGAASDVTAARRRGEAYLLERRLFRRRSNGEAIDRDRKGGAVWTRFGARLVTRSARAQAIADLGRVDDGVHREHGVPRPGDERRPHAHQLSSTLIRLEREIDAAIHGTVVLDRHQRADDLALA